MKPESPLNNFSDEVTLMGRQAGGRSSRARRDDFQDGSIDMHQTQVKWAVWRQGGGRPLWCGIKNGESGINTARRV